MQFPFASISYLQNKKRLAQNFKNSAKNEAISVFCRSVLRKINTTMKALYIGNMQKRKNGAAPVIGQYIEFIIDKTPLP